MAVGIGNQRIALIDLRTEQPRRIIENVDAAISFEEQGRVLLTLASNGLSRVHLSSNKISPPRQLDPPLVNFEIFSLSADHRFLAAENQPGQLCVWDMNLARRIEQSALPEGGRVTFLKFSPNNQQLGIVRERGENVLLYSLWIKELANFETAYARSLVDRFLEQRCVDCHGCDG